jgi:hypothetical protein
MRAGRPSREKLHRFRFRPCCPDWLIFSRDPEVFKTAGGLGAAAVCITRSAFRFEHTRYGIRSSSFHFCFLSEAESRCRSNSGDGVAHWVLYFFVEIVQNQKRGPTKTGFSIRKEDKEKAQGAKWK